MSLVVPPGLEATPPLASPARAIRAGAPPLFLTVAGVAVALLTLVPLGYVVVSAIQLGPTEAYDVLARRRVGDLFVNTVTLLAGVVVLSTTLGVAGAWLVERTDVPLRSVWRLLFVAPLAVPAFVNSYGWVSLTYSVQSYAGALLIVSLSYFPLVYLPVLAAFRTLDPALEEVAHSLGHSRWSTFRQITLRGVRPAILGGALLVGLHVLAEFGALRMLNYQTLTTGIYDQYRSAFNSAPANVLSGVLLLLCLVLLVIELRLRGEAALWRVGGGTLRPAEPVSLGRMRPVALGAALLVVALSLGVPLVSLARWLRVGSSTEFPIDELGGATLTTLALGAVAAAVTVLLALPVVWLAVRHRGRVGTVVERSTFSANALPGIVVGLAFVTIAARNLPGIYQTAPLLVLGYAVLFLPRAVVSLRASLEHAAPVLDEVSYSLGLSRPMTLWRVTLPMIRSGLGAGAALVFIAVSTELTATLLLSPIGTTTLATGFWSKSSAVQYGAAAPYALLLILVSIPATWMLSRQAVRGGGRP